MIKLLAILFLAIASFEAFGATRYVSYTLGNDGNAGTTTNAPWKHHPWMAAASSTAAAYSISPGDSMVLRGGDTWPYSVFPLTIPADTTNESTMIMHGAIDSNWTASTNGALAIFDGASNQVSFIVSGSNPSGHTFANLEIRHYSYGRAYYLIAPYYFTITNNWIHKWWQGADPLPPATDQNNGAIYNNYAGAGAGKQGIVQFLVTRCTINNVDGEGGVKGWGYGSAIRGAGEVSFCEIAYMNQMEFHGGYSIHDNWFHHGVISRNGGATDHPNATYLDNINGGNSGATLGIHSKCLVYNNLFDNMPLGNDISGIYPNRGSAGGNPTMTYYIWNNVCINWNTRALIQCDPYAFGTAGRSDDKIYSWNNTLHATWTNTVMLDHARRVECAQLQLWEWRNNHFTLTNLANVWSPNGMVASSVDSHNLTNSLGQAYAAGYSTNNYMQPSSASAPSVATGSNLTSFCTTHGLPSAAFYSTSAGNKVTPVARPASGNWDIGAFQFATASPPNITGTLLATGYVGTAFSYQITADNGVTAYGASNLPSGLTFSGVTGIISGTPLSSVTNSVTLLATNASGNDIDYLTLYILPGQAVISLSSSGLSFSEIMEDTTADLTIVVTNTGNAGTTLTGQATNESSPWSVVGNRNYALASGTSTNITVRFSPTTYGDFAGTISFTGGGGASAALLGEAYFKATVGTPFRAIETLLDVPWNSTNGYLIQYQETTDSSRGGRAIYGFTLTSAGQVTISATVNAPDTGRDSYFIEIDAEPASPTSQYDCSDIIPLTTGFESRYSNKRGTGTFDAPEFQPKYWNLTAGQHKFIVRAREQECGITNFTVNFTEQTSPSRSVRMGFPRFNRLR